jgi:phosphopantothenate---cysteine ligase (ATP)
LVIGQEHSHDLGEVWRAHKDTQGRLCMLPFTTVHEYLYILREVCALLAPCQERVLCYLAAAVSDFYVPLVQMAAHKVQSGSGPLTLQLEQVPKVLGRLVSAWVPKACVVTFKLETEEGLLESKARQALQRYGHQLVVGNILSTRKHRVSLFFGDRCADAAVPTGDVQVVEFDEATQVPLSSSLGRLGVCIEQLLMPRVVALHDSWINLISS